MSPLIDFWRSWQLQTKEQIGLKFNSLIKWVLVDLTLSISSVTTNVVSIIIGIILFPVLF